MSETGRDYKKIYESWMTSDAFDEAARAELEGISGDEEEIKDRFYKDLSFGTAGLRGVMGIGTNRMNVYTVGLAVQGLADYVNTYEQLSGGRIGIIQNSDDYTPVERKSVRSAVISYDCRHNSPEFADLAARILNANGIRTYMFPALRPTPELSFAVKALGCSTGIMVTSSHNTKEYNGMKFYGPDGCQMPDKPAGLVIECIDRLRDENDVTGAFKKVRIMDPEEARSSGLYNILDGEIDDRYMEALSGLILDRDSIEKKKDLKIVFTPLHGTGGEPVRRALTEAGFTDIVVVPEQEKPDGDFPSVEQPNPEYPEAFELALKIAKEKEADIVLATDPDGDRHGLYVRDKSGEYIRFSGNMSALVLLEYRLSQLTLKNSYAIDEAEMSDPKSATAFFRDSAIITTIVSSRMTRAIAKYYGAAVIEGYTGFKNICSVMTLCAEQSEKLSRDKKVYGSVFGAYRCLYGFEESFGVIPGDYARDKDGVATVLGLCEAAAHYLVKENKTLCDVMAEMYERYGYYRDGQLSVVLPGADGAAKISSYMNGLRTDRPLESIAGLKVLQVKDYENESFIFRNAITGNSIFNPEVSMPKSNVMVYELEGGCWLAVRPSGTEPKIKFYFEASGPDGNQVDEMIDRFKRDLAGIVIE